MGIDQWIASILQWLLTQGWPGVVVGALAIFAIMLFRDMRSELTLWRTRYVDLQDQRVKEAKETAADLRVVVEQNKTAIATLSDLIRDRRGRID